MFQAYLSVTGRTGFVHLNRHIQSRQSWHLMLQNINELHGHKRTASDGGIGHRHSGKEDLAQTATIERISDEDPAVLLSITQATIRNTVEHADVTPSA